MIILRKNAAHPWHNNVKGLNILFRSKNFKKDYGEEERFFISRDSLKKFKMSANIDLISLFRESANVYNESAQLFLSSIINILIH